MWQVESQRYEYENNYYNFKT